MSEQIQNEIHKTKNTAKNLSLLDDAARNQVLQLVVDKLRRSSALILQENAKDLQKMASSDPMYDRLLLSEKRLHSMAESIEKVISLATPTGQKISEKFLPNGLCIQKVSVPLGVIAVIYESRPNVTTDVFSLCFKAGNACILKGGKEASFSNQILVAIIHQALQESGIDPAAVYLLPAERTAALTLLHAAGLVDACIPRGSQVLIDFVRENAKIPVIETGAGIVHTYFDQSGDLEKGRLIINNAKTRRVSVCNALDTLIIHETRLTDLYDLIALLSFNNVEIFADEQSFQALTLHYPASLLHQAEQKDFGHEFLSYKMSIKTVASIKEAIAHITQYSSKHSEAIIAEDKQAIEYFLTRVDASAVYVNASTAFTDGGEFGMGTEIGISTQKLHARGPMGLEALTSYKWLVFGDGQIREN
ncbi:MAG: glutamate-5-semialdehyde dehydrogenase [Legionellales bacterium]|nr:glutamate-5-semialdehyde dehydrogenase [Legionellales bacterium]